MQGVSEGSVRQNAGALGPAKPFSDVDRASATESERLVAWIRLAALPVLALGETIPHPDPSSGRFYVVLAAFAVFGVAVLATTYRHEVGHRFAFVTTMIDIAAITTLAILSGGAYSPARLAFFLIPVTVAFRFRPALTTASVIVALAAYLLHPLIHHTSEGSMTSRDIAVGAAYLALVGVAAVLLSYALERRTESLVARAQQQQTVAELGRLALGTREPSLVREAAAARVAAQLDVAHADALELIPDAGALLPRSGVDLEHGPVGRLQARSFSDDDVSFLQSVANIVAASLERARADELVHASQEQLTVARRRLMADALAAEERERQALAESLHDSAIQNLLSARHELEEAAEVLEHPSLERADAALSSTISDLREAIFELHPYVLDEAGLDVAVRTVGERAARRGHFNLRCEVGRLSSQANGRLLLSAARELLANAAEHSGARNVTIRVTLRDASIVLEVEDDGTGFDAVSVLPARVAEGHIGLASQRERVESAGGSFEIESSPGHGTRVVVALPAAA